MDDRLTARKKRELRKLIVASADIGAAQRVCRYLLDHQSTPSTEPLYYPLYCSTVICYSRPFTNNRPFGPLEKRWTRFPTESQSALHQRVLETRHGMVAHSDHGKRRVSIHLSLVEGTDPPEANVGFSVDEEFFRETLFPGIKDLCDYLLSRILERAQELTMELINDGVYGEGSYDLDVANK